MPKLLFCLVLVKMLGAFSFIFAQTAAPQSVSAPQVHSQMQIPIRMTWEEIAKKVNSLLQGIIYDEKINSGGGEYQVKVWKIEPIGISGKAESLQSEASLRINIKGVYRTKVLGLGVSQDIDQDIKVKLTLNTKINIKPTWDVESKTQLTSYEWLETPYFTIGFVRIPISSILESAIEEQKATILKEIDKQLEKNLKFKTQIENAWKLFQTPFATSEWGKEKTWLWFSPEAPTVSPIEYLEEYLQVVLKMQAITEASLAVNPQKTTLKKLPKPTFTKEIPSPEAQLWVYGHTDYATARSKALEVFSKAPYSFRKGRYVVSVKDLQFSQEGAFFKIDLDLSGTVEGKVYLKGIPVFNPKTKRFEIDQFSYDAEDAQVRVSKFMRWMFAKKINRQIKEGFEDALDAQVQDLKKDIAKSLEQYAFDEYSTLIGRLDEFYFDSIQLENQVVRVRAILKGMFEIQLGNF